MASKVEDWWYGSYPKYSLKNFESMSIYSKFRESREYYSKGDHNYREAFWRVDNCNIFEWFDRKLQSGEKFGLDFNSYTYFYEHWYLDSDIHVVEKSWLRDTTEWGVIIKYYPTYEEIITWEIDKNTKNFEKTKKFEDKTEIEKSAKKITSDGIEDFTEKFWESKEARGKERVWSKGKSFGEEKEYNEGKDRWGESWVQDEEVYVKNEWHEKENKKWGVSEGQKGEETWEEKWEKDEESSFEEKKHVKNDKTWGSVRSKSSDCAYRLEWEGAKPEIIEPNSVVKTSQKNQKALKKPQKSALRAQKNTIKVTEDPFEVKESENSAEESENLKVSAGSNDFGEISGDQAKDNSEKSKNKRVSIISDDFEEIIPEEKKDLTKKHPSAMKKNEKKVLRAGRGHVKSSEEGPDSEKDHENELSEQKVPDSDDIDLSGKSKQDENKENELVQGKKNLGALSFPSESSNKELDYNEECASPRQISDFSKFGFQLSNLFDQLRENVDHRIFSLENSKDLPYLQEEINDLQLQLKEISGPKGFDPDSALESIRAINKIAEDLTKIEQQVIGSSPNMESIEKLFSDMNSNANSLQSVVDPSGQSGLQSEIERLKRDFNNSQSPSEKFQVLSNLNSLIKDILTFEKQKIGDIDREALEMTHKLEKHFKDLEEVIKESQGTLEKLENEFKPNDESIVPYHNAYLKRAEDINSSIQSTLPYNLTLPKISSLLTDIEKFKKEIIGTQCNETLKDLNKNHEELISEICEALNSPISLFNESQHDPNNLSELVEMLANREKALKALVKKLLGKNDFTGIPEIDQIKPRDLSENVINFEANSLLKFLWVNGKDLQHTISDILAPLLDTFASDSEKDLANDLLEKGLTSMTGVPHSKNSENLDQIKACLEEFLPSLDSQMHLLSDLSKKSLEKAKSSEIKPESLEDLWKILLLSDKLSEKLLPAEPPISLEQLRKSVDSLPVKPDLSEMYKFILKYQELNLSFYNQDGDLTAQELKDAENEAKKKRTGKSKFNKGKSKVLRAGKGGPKKLNIAQPSVDIIEKSLKTAGDLAVWVLGSKPNVSRHLAELSSAKEPIIKSIQDDGSSEEAIDGVFSFLNKLEDEKSVLFSRSDLVKNLLLIIQKSQKVLEATSQFLNVPVPPEAAELSKKGPTGDLTDCVKRTNFYLSLFFKMVKEATGVDDEVEHLDDAMATLMKKQAISMLPFDPLHLLGNLKEQHKKDLERLQFLAGLIGSQREIDICKEIDSKANAVLDDFSSKSVQEALDNIEMYLQHYPVIQGIITAETEELFNLLVQKLVRHEPLESDVKNLIQANENLNFAVKCLNEKNENFNEILQRNENLPTSPEELVPYLSEMVKDYSEINLKLLIDSGKIQKTHEQDLELKSIIEKKLRSAPVMILNDIQHLFAGVNTDDLIEIVLKLAFVSEKILKSSANPEVSQYEQCKSEINQLENLSSRQIKDLGKNLVNCILSFLIDPQETENLFEELEIAYSKVVTTRQRSQISAKITWEEVFKSRGLDLNGLILCEKIGEEQEFAKNYLEAFSGVFGSTEQKLSIKSLINKNQEIMKNPDEAFKLENYVHLRFEESKVMASLCQKMQVLTDRLNKLDLERGNTLKTKFSEIGMLVEKNNPSLKSELEVLISKETENLAQSSENITENVMRLTSRLGIEKELNRIKEEASPSDNSEAELIEKLSEIESKIYNSMRLFFRVLSEYSQELYPKDLSSLKVLTENPLSPTIAALFASIHSGLDSMYQFSLSTSSIILETPVKSYVETSLSLLFDEASKDDAETELVFSGLFRLCGSADDKSSAKKLREQKSITKEERKTLISLSELLDLQLKKFLVARSSQSKLQSKLVKEAGNMREGIDEIDLMTDDLLNKSVREASNTIAIDDKRSKDSLNSIKKNLDTINEESPTNIPEIISRVIKRLENWEKLERLRKDLREKQSKEINKLKAEVQDKVNELETAKALFEGSKAQYEAQITLVRNEADQNSLLVEKLTQEASDKEKDLSNTKNRVNQLMVEIERAQEDLQRLQDEVDSNNKELRNLRKSNKDKDAVIRDFQNNLDSLERSHEKESIGDKEKGEIIEKYRLENKNLNEEIVQKNKNIDDLEEKVNVLERNVQKLGIENNDFQKEIEGLKKEKIQLKSANLKLETDKNELQEQVKLSEGVSPDEVRQLERILEEKQKELDEIQDKFNVAHRYQVLYIDLSVEKQELENNLKDSEIKLEDIQRKIEDLKQENDQLKYKSRAIDQIQKEAATAQKENQKLQLRLNFLESSADLPQDSLELMRKTSEVIAKKDLEIEDLQNELENIKKKLMQQQKKYDLSLSRSFLIRICNVFKQQESQSFRKWANFDPNKQPSLSILETLEKPFTQIEIEEEKDLQNDYEAADKALHELNQDLIHSNPIMHTFKSIEGKFEKPMSYMNVFKFLEEIMDKKFETDKKDIADLRQMRSMTEFIMEYISRSFGISSLAQRFLGQFIPGFYSIYSEGHKYAVFYARLLQVFHQDPIPYSLALYLVRARMEFHPLIEKYERFVNDQGKKKEVVRKKDLYGRNNFELAGTGGLALLTDVIELIYSIFSGDRESGLKALELLQPEKVSQEDFVAFKICHKMAKLGKTPEMIFTMLDKDEGGTIDAQEFLTGTKEDLDLWISDKNIMKLMEQLSENQVITKEAFFSRINMKTLMECNKSPLWAVSKASFLIAMTEVYRFKQRKLAAHLNPNFAKYGKTRLDKDEFSELVLKYEPNIPGDAIERLREEARADQGIDFKTISFIFSKYGLGELKIFRIRELMQQLSNRKFVMDISVSDTSQVRKNQYSSQIGNALVETDEEQQIIIRKKTIKKLIKK